VATTIVDQDFNDIADEVKDSKKRPARLCGSNSTCVAIVETGDDLES
jgi:hypothetical protein